MKKEDILENIKILYIEDDKNLRDTISDSLRLYKIDFQTAVDGVDGLEKFKKDNFDLIISDIKMPNLNGVAMMKSIRKIDEKIPLIFTTAFNDSEYLLGAISLRANSYLIKPLVVEELINEIENIMRPVFQNNELKKQKEIIDNQARELLINNLLLTISHQWRQPLSLICAISTKFRLQLELGDINLSELDKGLENIEDQASTMSDILINYEKLFISSINDKILLKELIEEMVLFLKRSIKECDIKCMLNIDNDIYLDCKRSELVQILLIVFQNIIKNYKILNLSNDEVKVFTHYDDEYLILEIAPSVDDGIKIDNLLVDIIQDNMRKFCDGKMVNNGLSTSLYISKLKLVNYNEDNNESFI
ncbi:MAG: hybrid sensor histidine kinase/response regulator [Arcobacteraceae bacterium]|nr:hybrid sensor histidine kinase/response regulator [Arcobacteraceae bacterium]